MADSSSPRRFVRPPFGVRRSWSVVYLGDSITWGWVPPIPFVPSYTTRLGAEYPTKRMGASGAEQTTNWLPAAARYISLQAYLPADIAVVLLGTNDALIAQRSAAEYGANIALIVDALLDDGVGLVQLMSPPYDRDNSEDALFDGYATQLSALAALTDGAEYGPDLRPLILGPEYEVTDSVHPNVAGHIKIAAALETELDTNRP